MHHAKAALAGAVIVMTLACGSDTTGPRDVSGVYTLRTVNGSLLPYTVPNSGGGTIVIEALTATLFAGGIYSTTATGTLSGVDTTVLADQGLYEMEQGAQVNFVSGAIESGAFFAKAKTDTLVLTLPGGFLNSTNPTFSLVLVK